MNNKFQRHGTGIYWTKDMRTEGEFRENRLAKLKIAHLNKQDNIDIKNGRKMIHLEIFIKVDLGQCLERC